MLRSFCATLALLGSLLASSLSTTAAPGVGEWTQFGNGPEHNGYYPRTIGTAPFTADWSRTFPTTLNQVVVSGDTVYGTLSSYFGSGQKAFALKVTDGTDRWNFPLAQCFSVNPPSYSGGRVYFQRGNHASDTHLWCLDAATGSLKWAAPHAAQWESYMAPTIADGGVFVNGGSYGGLYGFDAITGAQRFFVSLPQEDGWTPGYANGVVYSCVNGTFTATNPSTGSQLWTRTLTSPNSYFSEGDVPVLADGKIIIRLPGRLVVLDATTRAQVWSVDAAFAGTPAVVDGTVYVLLGATVKAYRLTDGLVTGTYTASGTLSGQPLLTKDLLLVSSSASTYVYDRTTAAQLQVLPAGGALSYACGRLYVATSAASSSTFALNTYVVNAAEADPAPQPLPADPGRQPHPNPDLNLGTTTASWLDATRSGDIAYFLFASPNKIERYNIATGTWLKPISLPSTPTAFTVASGGIYVGFGTSISAFALDGSTETVLGNTVSVIGTVRELNGKLYLGQASGSNIIVMNAATGSIAGVSSLSYSQAGLTIAPTKNKLFGVSGYSILQTVINGDGSLGAQTQSPSSGAYPTGTRTFLFGGEGRVATNAGIIYSTGDLSYLGSLAGAFTDGDFSGSSPVLLRNNTLVGYSPSLLETGRKTLTGSPTRIFVTNGQIASFAFLSGRGVAETVTALSDLVPPDPGTGIDPTNLNYTPDAIEFGTGDIVYLLSKLQQSVFRWSVAERRYLSSIPLAEAPQYFTYAAAQNRLYFSYSTGRISKIDLDSSFTEVSFANSPLAPRGLVAAGEYLFVEDTSGAWATHYVYSPAGALLSSKEWNYYSREYIWNATNRKMYFFRDDQSPNDVIWEDIDLEGKLGAEVDSPYHGTYSIVHPVRVSPDGTQVVLGNGDLYAGVSLARLGTLGTNINDAIWLNGTLITASSATTPGNSAPTSGTLRSWTAGGQGIASTSIAGAPTRLFPLSNSVLAVTQTPRGVVFVKTDADLQQLSADPINISIPTPPIATTLAAANVSSTTATLNGTVDAQGEATTYYFQYGTTSKYGSTYSAQPVGTGTGAQALTQDTASLTPGTTYHYRLVAVNADGTSYGMDNTFQTGVAKAVVYSPSLYSITTTDAVVSGYVNPAGSATTAYVEYGTTTALGQTTASLDIGASTSLVYVTRTLSGLQPATKYYYRLSASNMGGVSTSGISFFTTANPIAAALAVTQGATGVATGSAILHGSVTPGTLFTYVSFNYGTTASANQYATPESLLSPGSSAVPLQQVISGLMPQTTYFFRMKARTAAGSVYGDPISFTTLAPLVASNDRVFLPTRKPLVIDVLANDTGAARADLSIASVGAAVGGKVTINADQTLTYQPYSFVVSVDTFTYEILDTGGRRSTASVTVRNDWRGAEGSYDALVGTESSDLPKTGSVRATLTAAGSFTGGLWLGGTYTGFRGKLTSESSAVVPLKTAYGTVSLALSLDVESNQLAGSVTINQEALPFSATRTMRDADRVRPLAGRYTLLLQASDSETVAEGSGYASLLVDKNGGAWLVGRSPDGVAFSLTAGIGADGRFPLYAVQGAKRDRNLHGWAAFPSLPVTNDLDGLIGWSHAASPTVAADTKVLTLLGSAYVAPSRTGLPLSVTVGTSNSVLKFGSAGTLLTAPIAATLLHSQITAPNRVLSGVTLNLTTGLFSGVVTAAGHRSPFYGAFYQRGTVGSGVYLGPNGPGWLSLEAFVPLQTQGNTPLK